MTPACKCSELSDSFLSVYIRNDAATTFNIWVIPSECTRKTLKVAEVKDGAMAVKMEAANESISIYLEQGNTTVINITNPFINSTEQYAVVYGEQLPHSTFRAFSIRITYITLR